MNEGIFISTVLALVVVLWAKRRAIFRQLSRRSGMLEAGTGTGKSVNTVGPFHCPYCKHTVFIDKNYTKHSNLITCPYCGKHLRVPNLKFNLIDPMNGVRKHLKNLKNRKNQQEQDQDK